MLSSEASRHPTHAAGHTWASQTDADGDAVTKLRSFLFTLSDLLTMSISGRAEHFHFVKAVFSCCVCGGTGRFILYPHTNIVFIHLFHSELFDEGCWDHHVKACWVAGKKQPLGKWWADWEESLHCGIENVFSWCFWKWGDLWGWVSL